MERDFSIRFTDEMYASKDDVKHALNISSVDQIWDKINNYRSYYKKNLDLMSIERKPFSLTLTVSISQRIISLEKKFSKLLVYLSRLSPEDYDKVVLDSLLDIARSYAKENSLTVDDQTLLMLISDDTKDVSQAFLSLKNYLSTVKNYMNKSASKYSLGVFTSFYGKILKKEIDPTDFESYARMIDHNNPADHVVFGRHYNAAPLERLEELLESVFEFNDKSYVFVMAKAIVTYYYLIYIKPFDYFNEECALLSMKYILSHEDNEVVPYLLNFEKYFLNIQSKEFESVFILSEMTQDLTYFLNFVLDKMELCFEDFSSLVEMMDIHQIKKEFAQADDTNLPKEAFGNSSNQFSFPNPIVYEQKVSMPTMPVGLDEKDVNLIAENLLELYPSLKRNQAIFYAGHCTIGKYYSIAQYKKETGVAYETARTSMDNLVNLGFYKKEQIKNKFVYTPVVR